MRLRFILLFMLCSNFAISQAPYGNEWIDYSKSHYKFTITKDGIYRIPYSLISAVCTDIANENSNQFCLYKNGVKVPIYVSWTTTPNAMDYIEFFGEKPDGSIDAMLYSSPDHPINPYHSLVTDTSFYYLTVRNEINPFITNYTNDTSIASTSVNECIGESLNIYKNRFSHGKRYYYSSTGYTTSSQYEVGEGFCTNATSNAISCPNIINTSSTQSSLQTRIYGNNDILHDIDIQVNNTSIHNEQFTSNEIAKISKQFNTSLLNTSNTIKLVPNKTAPHGYFTGFINIKYPRNLTFNANSDFSKFYLPASNSSKKIRFNNFNAINAILLNKTNNTRTSNSSNSTFLIQSHASENEFVLYDEAQTKTINEIYKKVFFDISKTEGNYIIISDKDLQKDDNGINILEEYKNYKNSLSQENHNAIIVYTSDISENYSYGISKHPLGIRKFLQKAYNSWTINPKFVFLIGKGNAAYQLRTTNESRFVNNRIPAFGLPASDYHYTTMDDTFIQFASIGRLSARTGQTIRDYLSKLKEYDNQYYSISNSDQTPENKEYMKWVVHLGGGSGVDEQFQFKSNLRQFENYLKDTSYGAKVFSIFKNNSDVSQDVSSVDLSQRINKGVSLITFFGHSSAHIFDVGIGNPNEFTNQGKYPFFLANGCNSGYVYNFSDSYSEEFVNLPNKGAIGFVATTNSALNSSLYRYGNEFSKLISSNYYNSFIGDIIRASSTNILRTTAINYLHTAPMIFNLNGDPSVRFGQYPEPDYYIDKSYAYFNPNGVNTSQDSFTMYLKVQNLGKAINSPMKIKVDRTVNSQKFEYKFQANTPYFLDTFELSLPTMEDNVGFGLNNFSIKVESDETIDEISELNNEIQNIVQLYIENDAIVPIHPCDFSIYGNDKIELISSSTISTDKTNSYLVEIDTSENFNSSIKQHTSIASKESIISWKPTITLLDSTVYYWRIKRVGSQNDLWTYRSFIYIKGYPYTGWNQSHYFQFKKDNFSNIELPESREFKYVDDVKHIKVRTDGSNGTYEVEWYLNNARVAAFREQSRITNGLHIVWIKGSSGLTETSVDTIINGATWGEHGSVRFGYTGLPREGFVFQDTGSTPNNHPLPNTPWSTVIKNFIDQIPDGDYVFFYTLKKPVYTSWDNTLKGLFQNAGFSQLSSLTNGSIVAPFVFAYRKNNMSFTPYQKIGTDYVSKTIGEFFIQGNWKEGYINSTKIGPSKKWRTLKYNLSSIENIDTDKNLVSLIGIDKLNNSQVLYSTSNLAIDTTIEWIDHNEFPFLQLRLYSADDINRTPTQLNYWRVLFDEYPELVSTGKNTIIDTIENGQDYVNTLPLENISSISFDSLSLKITLSQGSNSKTFYKKVSPLVANAKNSIPINFNHSQYYEGENNILYEFNTRDTLYQNEKYAFNNFGKSKFFVKSDIYNPLLDVTFDGVRIVNNEIVSSNPEINVILKDENKYLLLNDTSLVNLSLKYPDGSIRPIHFSSNILNYTLATSAQKNNMEINFKPALTDGSYQLIVQDNDRSSNSSSQNGTFDYKISFQVISKKQVSRFINYPNPFSTSTQFVFTLTGSKVPEHIKIQIINIRGEVVREIFKDELGPIKLGMNRTEFKWNGTDQYGHILANGVYLYKVFVQDDGEDIPLMESTDFMNIHKTKNNLEKYFNNGWGKMVILR